MIGEAEPSPKSPGIPTITSHVDIPTASMDIDLTPKQSTLLFGEHNARKVKAAGP